MSLTPEQWRELDELRDRYGETCDADDCDCKYVRDRFVAALLKNHGTLIDAARPKCGRCIGDPGVSYETRVAPEAEYGGRLVARQHRIDCPEVPGW